MKPWVLIITLFFATSCIVQTNPPEIIFFTPPPNAVLSQPVPILISFSKSMDKTKTQKAFALLSGIYGDSSVKGYFAWTKHNTLMQFIPEEPLSNGYYRLILTNTACDAHDNSITTQLLSSFVIGSDIIPPEIMAVYPANASESIPLNTPILITFSKCMDTPSVEKNIRFSPSVEYICTWNDLHTVLTITPQRPLLFNTWYTMELSQCQDIYHNSMINPVSLKFRTGQEYVRPYISGLYTTSITQNMATGTNGSIYNGANIIDDIIIIFSEPVDTASLASAFTITPSVNWNAYWEQSNQQCTIKFTQSLQPHTLYELVINTTLKDTAQNTLEQDCVVYIVTDGSLSQYPTIVSLQCVNPSHTLVPFQSNYLETEQSSNNTYSFAVQFSAAMVRSSIPENIIIQCLYGEDPNKSGSISRYIWSNNNQNLQLDISALEGGNVYKLTFKGGYNGIQSTNGISLQEDIWYIFYFSPND